MTRRIEIIRCWSDGTWSSKDYEFPGAPGDPLPDQATIIATVLANEPLDLDMNEDLVTCCLYFAGGNAFLDESQGSPR